MNSITKAILDTNKIPIEKGFSSPGTMWQLKNDNGLNLVDYQFAIAYIPLFVLWLTYGKNTCMASV